MIADADRGLKERMGKLAYWWTGLRHAGSSVVATTVDLDGERWFEGDASCVLFGNVGTVGGGIEAFDDAKPDDGWLEVGVSTAKGPIEWARDPGPRCRRDARTSRPSSRITRAKKVTVGSRRRPRTRWTAAPRAEHSSSR